jgi:hypothetical protein
MMQILNEKCHIEYTIICETSQEAIKVKKFIDENNIPPLNNNASREEDLKKSVMKNTAFVDKVSSNEGPFKSNISNKVKDALVEKKADKLMIKSAIEMGLNEEMFNIIVPTKNKVREATEKALKENITFSKSFQLLFGRKASGAESVKSKSYGYLNPDIIAKEKLKKSFIKTCIPKNKGMTASEYDKKLQEKIDNDNKRRIEYEAKLKKDSEYMNKINRG